MVPQRGAVTVDQAQLAIKVDVCTYTALKDGVPSLLQVFDHFGIRGSFFVACGPDHSGRAIRRVLRPGFFAKMLRTNAVSTYGWRTLLYGTLLPGPQIARSFPDTLRALVGAGHEVAMHGYDHVYWHDRLARLSPAAVGAELERARAAFTAAVGSAPQAFGAPGWQCTAASLASEDAAGLTYHSDTRGHAPYLPEMNGQRFRTMEIPTTLPTIDETYGRIGTTPEALAEFYAQQLRPGLNVYTAHAEMEGLRQLPHFCAMLERLRGRAGFTRLIDVAHALQKTPDQLPVVRVVAAPIVGRAGTVAWQESARA